MISIDGEIRTWHADARTVAAAISPDNLRLMDTTPEGEHVVTKIHGTKLRSVIASVDDYLMNLAIAEEIHCCTLH